MSVMKGAAKPALGISNCSPGQKSAESDVAGHPCVRVQAVGLLTTEEREVWAVWRSELIKASANNAENFRIVDSAIFVLCLDDTSPASQVVSPFPSKTAPWLKPACISACFSFRRRVPINGCSHQRIHHEALAIDEARSIWMTPLLWLMSVCAYPSG